MRRTRAIACLRRPTAAPGTVSGARSTAGAASGVEDVVKDDGASNAAGVSMESAMRAIVGILFRALLGDLGQGVRRGLLSRVRVLGTRVDLQLLDLGAAE